MTSPPQEVSNIFDLLGAPLLEAAKTMNVLLSSVLEFSCIVTLLCLFGLLSQLQDREMYLTGLL